MNIHLKKICVPGSPILILALLALSASVGAAASCPDLASAQLEHARIDSAALEAPGQFVPPGGMGSGPSVYSNLPEFCRVTATLTPSPDSNIKIEVWMPTENWNGKYQAVGNGGWAGSISYTAMAEALERGYATSSTDTGHVGGRGQFALGHPEKLVDYAERSVHQMALKSKMLIEDFYGRAPQYSYFVGCSTGGKQGLTEAQRYPNDFDGIVAGAPANYMIHLHLWSIYVNNLAHRTPASFLDAKDLQVLKAGVMAQCDALDGVEDGVLGNPHECHFDPQLVACESASSQNCLNPPKVVTARSAYTPAKTATGQLVFPSFEPGSEASWTFLMGKKANDIPADTFRYVIFKDPAWDPTTLDLNVDTEKADKIDNGLNNAIDPNLTPFFKHGGKLLMYHGWNDGLIAPGNSINYYNSVAAKLGGVSKIDNNMRLFMVPGMDHCRGGDGPNSFDAVSVIEQWREEQKAPTEIIASHRTDGEVDRTRPLCKYPEVAVYNGSGSTDDAANFSCRVQ